MMVIKTCCNSVLVWLHVWNLWLEHVKSFLREKFFLWKFKEILRTDYRWSREGKGIKKIESSDEIVKLISLKIDNSKKERISLLLRISRWKLLILEVNFNSVFKVIQISLTLNFHINFNQEHLRQLLLSNSLEPFFRGISKNVLN